MIKLSALLRTHPGTQWALSTMVFKYHDHHQHHDHHHGELQTLDHEIFFHS